jgi:predicted DNA-binding transcriptional regulator AlpA
MTAHEPRVQNHRLESMMQIETTVLEAENPPALLTLAMIRRYYVPIASRTLFRLISSGQFPKADIGIGGKLRLWKRETIERWIATQSPTR